VLSEDNRDGRAAIRGTELLLCNEASDAATREGESSSSREILHPFKVASRPTGALLPAAIQNLSFAR